MNQWGYRLFILFVLIFTACSRKINTVPLPQMPVANELSNLSTEGESVAPLPLDPPVKTEKKTVPTAASEGKIVLPEINPLDIEGHLIVAGSSTVFPITQAIYQRFIEEGFSGIIKLDSIGTSAGFRLFCKEGETDIANASRPIKDTEIEACTANGRQPIEFRVGTDALAVVVHPANHFISNATIKELAAIFTAEKWSDVNPAWPNELIKRFIPGTDSGTFDFFVETVFAGDRESILNVPNTELSEDDNDLVQGVAADPYAIGFFGYAYYHENANTLKILAIEGIEPNAETVDHAEYPLARPLLIYSDAKIIEKKPQVGAFINFYLTHVNEEIERIGYFPASPKFIDQGKINLLKSLGYEELLSQ